MKCICCGKEKDSLELSRRNICVSCLQDLLDNVAAGGAKRKSAVNKAERFTVPDLIAGSPLLKYWDESVFMASGTRQRIESAKTTMCFSVHPESESGRAASGSTGAIYDITLQSCTCPDFAMRKKPCKHMFALANKMMKK